MRTYTPAIRCSQFILCLLIVALFSACRDNIKDTPAVRQSALHAAQQYLSHQYDYLTGKSREAGWKSMNAPGVADSLVQQINEYSRSLSLIKFAYTDYSSVLSIDSFFIKKGEIHLAVKEIYSLVTNDKDPDDTTRFITTRGISGYDFALTEKDGKFSVKSFSAYEPGRFKSNQKYFSLPETSAAPSEPQPGARLYAYSAAAARQYAYDNYQQGHPDYCDFTSGGGDCTNFLSQCLMKGGWTAMTNVWESKKKNGCTPPCVNTSCAAHECYTCSWTVAQDFKYFITHAGAGRKESANYPDYELGPGDILQMAHTSSGNVVHSTIVTKKTGTGTAAKVYVTYRTNGDSRYGPAMDKLSTDVGISYHYGWKLKASAN